MIDVEIHILAHLLYAIEHIQQSQNNILTATTTNVIIKNIFNFLLVILFSPIFTIYTTFLEYIVIICYSLAVILIYS